MLFIWSLWVCHIDTKNPILSVGGQRSSGRGGKNIFDQTCCTSSAPAIRQIQNTQKWIMETAMSVDFLTLIYCRSNNHVFCLDHIFSSNTLV